MPLYVFAVMYKAGVSCTCNTFKYMGYLGLPVVHTWGYLGLSVVRTWGTWGYLWYAHGVPGVLE